MKKIRIQCIISVTVTVALTIVMILTVYFDRYAISFLAAMAYLVSIVVTANRFSEYSFQKMACRRAQDAGTTLEFK